MQPVPLTGTTTLGQILLLAELRKDAARTPHGDSNRSQATVYNDSLSMQPAPLTGTATKFLHIRLKVIS